MIIDKGKLIALLVEKTGQPKAEVEEQLEKLKERIRNVAKSGGAFEVRGFGTFTGQNGMPGFEPSEQLKTEINQKYAGMKPIELMEPFKETGAGIPVEESTEEPAPPELEEPEEKAPKPIEEPEEEEIPEPEEPSAPVEPEQEPPVESGKEPVTSEPEEEQPVAASVEEDEPSKTEEEPAPDPQERPPEKKKSAQPKYKTPAFAERNNNKWSTIFFTAIIVIGLLAAGWAMFDAGVFTDSAGGNENGASPDTAGITGVPPTTPAVGDTADTADNLEQNARDTVSSNSGTQMESTGSVYGLKGTVTEEGQDGYTIVIHSFRLRSTVQEIADSLAQENYRTLLIDGRVSGETRWRLGVGQFETIEDAKSALEQLPRSVRSNYFITRIE